MTPLAAVPDQASSKTPTKGQSQVLWALKHLGATVHPGALTGAVHELRDATSVKQRGISIGTIASTFEHLRQCHRHFWVAPAVMGAAGKNRFGEHIAWHVTPGGLAALERGLAVVNQPDEESEMEAVETPAPEWAQNTPLEEVPAEAPETQEEAAHDASEDTREEVREEVVDDKDVEVEEEPVVVENQVVGNQLTMKVVDGRLKPTQSTLKVNAKQVEFGTTREFKIGDRVPFEGVLEIREVSILQKANGRVVRVQKAVITESELLTDAADGE